MSPFILYFQMIASHLEESLGRTGFYALFAVVVIGDFALWEWQRNLFVCIVFVIAVFGGAAWIAMRHAGDDPSTPIEESDDHA